MMPLSGKRILVTRPRAQAADLCDKLAALGAEPIQFPTIEIAPLDDYTALDRAIVELCHSGPSASGGEREASRSREVETLRSVQGDRPYQWVIFTSANGVSAFWQRLEVARKDSNALDDIRVAAIGPATARALEKRGIAAQFIPDEYVAEAIVEGIGDVRGQRILLPRADIAREALAVELKQCGALVEEIVAYRTLPAAPDPHGLAELRRGVDVITFTSSSTARNFVALVERKTFGAAVACIGPITARTVRELGLPVNVMATEYTMDGLVTALVRYFEEV
jgi:uroporphyrinogen-III synthase